MQRIVVLGGGVGGTLVANLLVRKLRREIDRGEASVLVVDQTGEHVYQPGFMYIAMGNEKAEHLTRPEASLLDDRVQLEVGRVDRIDPAAGRIGLDGGREIAYDQLIVATGSRIVPEEIEHFDTEAHHFYGADAALRLRKALDAFTGGRIVIGIAGMPYKCPPAPLEVAFLIEDELRQRGLRAGSEMHYCSPIGRAFTIESVSEMATPILEEKGIELHTFFNVETIDPERKVVHSLEGEELPYDLLILVPPHRGAKLVDRRRSRAARAAGCRPITTPSRSEVGRTSTRSATRPIFRSRRPARPRTSRPRSWPSESPRRCRGVSRTASMPATPAR